MKKLIIKKLSDHSIIAQTQVADHDEFQWVIENKHSFGQDDVFEDYEHLIEVASIETVKEAYDEIIPEHVITKEAYDKIIPEYVDEDGVTVPEQVISHPAEDVVVPEQVISHPAELIEHPAVYETRQRIAIPKDWYVETIDVTKVNTEALLYLSETDWYIIRELDAGIPCPAEIKEERAAARLRVTK